MAAGVSIMIARHRPLGLVLIGFLLTSTYGFLNPDPYRGYICPGVCTCYKMNETSNSPSARMDCSVLAFNYGDQTRGVLQTASASSSLNAYAHFTCLEQDNYFTKRPDSVLWDGAFSGLTHLRALSFKGCAFKTVSGAAFKGLDRLSQLSIEDATISLFDPDLPKLESLKVTSSGVTLLPALCRTGSNLRILNLTDNFLPSFDAAGVRCTGSSNAGGGASLSRLETLDLRSNNLTSWPRWLGESLPSLVHLAVANNRISRSEPNAFRGLPQLTHLDMADNAITSFNEDFFGGVNAHLQSLILSHNPVSVLPFNMFARLVHLRRLDLSDMALDQKVWTEIGRLQNLLHLNLSMNRLQDISVDKLSQLPLLETLYLSRNYLDSLPNEAFGAQSRMTLLDLSYNRIRGIPKDSFNGMSQLRHLYINNNKLSLLDQGGRASTNRLQTLDLNSNKLIWLHDDLLAHTPGLTHLNMSRNQLKQLLDQPLPPSLISVDFSYNNVAGPIAARLFDGVTRVREIHLNNNRLRALPLKMFNSCGELRRLDLSHNEIEELDENLFTGASLLEEIDLSYNKLTQIGNVFSRMKRLKVLNLARNKITEIHRDNFPHRIESIDLSNNLISSILAHTFKSLSSLRTVNLRANNLTTLARTGVELDYNVLVSPTFFLNYNPLSCDCNLGWLKDWSQDTLPEMKTLPNFKDVADLYCKNLVNTELSSLKRESFVCAYKKNVLDSCSCKDFAYCYCVHKCPPSCQCFMGDKYMEVNRISCSNAGLRELPKEIPIGATELHLDGNDIEEIPKHSFIGLEHVEVLYLNNSGIKAIYNHTMKGLKSMKRLYLNDNSLTEIFSAAFEGLDNLVELYLQNNQIAFIESNALLTPQSLMTLNLRSNALVTLSLDELWGLLNRTVENNKDNEDETRIVRRATPSRDMRRMSVSLSDNPWTCEATFACSFLSFLEHNAESIEDMKFIQCVPEPAAAYVTKIVESDAAQTLPKTSTHAPVVVGVEASPTWRNILDLRGDVCGDGDGKSPTNGTSFNVTAASVDPAPSDSKTYALVAACVAVVLVVALVVAIFANRHLLQVLCFTRFGCRVFKPARAEDNDDDLAGVGERPYDAFICHSNKDEDFVLQELVPRLEDGDKQFRLCVHYRDFPVGACIAETIARSVGASKRTILVLSENFLESEWCKFEFQTAHEQVLKEKKSRVIILLRDDLDPNKVKDKNLRAYLRTRTYLKVGEPFFWEKLMFAMPDVSRRQKINNQRRRHLDGAGVKGNDLGLGDYEHQNQMGQPYPLEVQQQQQRLLQYQQQKIPAQPYHAQQFIVAPNVLRQHHQQQLGAAHPAVNQMVVRNNSNHSMQHNNHPQDNNVLQNNHARGNHLPLTPHQTHLAGYLYEEQQPPPTPQPQIIMSLYHQQQQLIQQQRHHHPYHHQHYQPDHQQQQVCYAGGGGGSIVSFNPDESYEIPLQESPTHSTSYQHHTTSVNGGQFEHSSASLPVGMVGLHHIGALPSNNNAHHNNHHLHERLTGCSPCSPRQTGSCCSSTHTNSAFHNSDDSSTSGYHNGSGCSSCGGGHYEEVGPGSSSVVSTPLKSNLPGVGGPGLVMCSPAPPPIPLIPKEGFVPIDRHPSINA